MKRAMIQILFFCLVIAAYSPSFGVMMGLSTEELTKSSDLIVVGSVQSIESMWSKDGRMIISRAKIIVHSVINGRWDQDILNVEYLGGEVGDIGLQVSDVKPLKQGENVLLFLKTKNEQDQKAGENLTPSMKEEKIHSIVGNAQGQYTITPQGMAKKDGFSVMQGSELIDNNIPLEVLIDKIRGVKK